MPRATNKVELQQAAEVQYVKLIQLLNSRTDEQREAEVAFNDRDRCVRDVIVYLYEWHQLFLLWLRDNRADRKRSLPPAPTSGPTTRL